MKHSSGDQTTDRQLRVDIFSTTTGYPAWIFERSRKDDCRAPQGAVTSREPEPRSVPRGHRLFPWERQQPTKGQLAAFRVHGERRVPKKGPIPDGRYYLSPAALGEGPIGFVLFKFSRSVTRPLQGDYSWSRNVAALVEMTNA